MLNIGMCMCQDDCWPVAIDKSYWLIDEWKLAKRWWTIFDSIRNNNSYELLIANV